MSLKRTKREKDTHMTRKIFRENTLVKNAKRRIIDEMKTKLLLYIERSVELLVTQKTSASSFDFALLYVYKIDTR